MQERKEMYKNVLFKWDREQRFSFNKVNELLTNTPVLKVVNRHYEITI